MVRTPAVALAALLAFPCAVRAQQAPAGDGKAAAAELDPRLRAAIEAEVEKRTKTAEDRIRNEVRAELQGAQSAAEFMGTVKDAPKIDVFELDGYFRTRGQILDRLHLRSDLDASGYGYFPRPRQGPWLSEANMRLRLEPTIHASETVRVRAQLDVLDNYLLGSNASKASDSTGSPYPVPFYGSTRTYYPGDKTNDRDPIIPRRVWGEVQTPVGLLTFGRQPSAWGLGILANAGTGYEADYGDTVDRLQFALPPVATPAGDLVLVPMIDFDYSGVAVADPHQGAGVGQPIATDQTDKATTLAFKVARLDTEDELRRKLERGERSTNFGLYYNYRSQQNVYPAWQELGYAGDYRVNGNDATQPFAKRAASAHVASLWGRWLSGKWRVEGEAVGVYGRIGQPNIVANVNPDGSSSAGTDATTLAQSIDVRQWGYVLQVEYKQSSALSVAGELGAASGDSAPGFGNNPDRRQTDGGQGIKGSLPGYGSIEGPQWGYHGDRSINNYRFNPAYQPDLILFRRILGQVTDAWYLRPSVRWEVIPGLTFDGAAIYSQAMFGQSTPSASELDGKLTSTGHRPLGLELDGKLTLNPGNGFRMWGDVGMLKPLDGFGHGTSLAWVFEYGVAATF